MRAFFIALDILALGLNAYVQVSIVRTLLRRTKKDVNLDDSDHGKDRREE
jgi:hypothetical protein